MRHIALMRNQRAGKVVLVMAGLITGFFLTEAAAYVFGITIPLTHEFFLMSPEVVKSPLYIFEKKQVQVADSDGGYRIAIIGDSFSDCGISLNGSCYPNQVKELLERSGLKITMVNFAVTGNNTDREFRYVQDHVIPWRPDLVIWQFYANDVWENVLFPVYTVSRSQELVPLAAFQNWAYQRQTFFELLPFKELALRTVLVRGILRLFEYGSYRETPNQSDSQRVAWGLEKIRLQIQQMNALSAAHGFDVLYLQVPPQGLYLSNEPEDTYSAWAWDNNRRMYHLINALLREQAGYVDIRFPVSSDGGTAVLGDTTEPVSGRYYLGTEDPNAIGDKHLNAEGQYGVALQLYNRVHSLVSR